MAPTLATYHAPGLGLLQTEGMRAAVESVNYVCALPRLTDGPRGDGHHVLVLPGLMAGDKSTLGLRHVLNLRGYRPHTWRQGLNIGPTHPTMAGLTRRLGTLYVRGNRPVSVVGWSLGGILGEPASRRIPQPGVGSRAASGPGGVQLTCR